MISKAGLDSRDQELSSSMGEDRSKPSLLPEGEVEHSDELWLAGRQLEGGS